MKRSHDWKTPQGQPLIFKMWYLGGIDLTVTVSAGSVITKSAEAAWIFRLIMVLLLTARLSIRKGDYIDAIFHCPFEINELVSDVDLSKILNKLSDDHKEIIFNNFVRGTSTKALGKIREQSDRNIRKVRATALKKIHKALLKVLLSRKEKGYPLTMEEKLFIEKALDGSKGN